MSRVTTFEYALKHFVNVYLQKQAVGQIWPMGSSLLTLIFMLSPFPLVWNNFLWFLYFVTWKCITCSTHLEDIYYVLNTNVDYIWVSFNVHISVYSINNYGKIYWMPWGKIRKSMQSLFLIFFPFHS